MQIKALLFALLISSCINKTNLPILSSYIDNDGKYINYTITNFNFTNQFNKTVTKEDTNNQVYIANFFFTRCPSICPKMKTTLINIAQEFEGNSNFTIMSFSIDPKHDTVPVLKSYAESTGILSKKWHFLNGTDDQLEHIAKLFRSSFNLKYDHSIDFYHSSFAALVDKKQQIRGFYNLLDAKSVDNLTNDIYQLLE